MATVPGWDAIHVNVAHAPAGQQGAGYTTGFGDVPWTAADWAAHPKAVRIDQDAHASDGTADVLDVEAGAATPADCPGWVNRARASYKAGTRPGQRQPAIYVNRSNMTAVANALASAGLTGVGLWVADWNLTEAQAASEVAAASGPYPVVAVQYSDKGGGGAYDLDVYSAAWLNTVSAKPGPKHGPFGHSAPEAPGDSLWRVAKDRSTTVGHIRTVSAGYLTPAHLAILDAYIALGDAVAAAKDPGIPPPVMPTGMRYATDNP